MRDLFIRFGDLPESGKSKIYFHGQEIGEEEGVSVYPAFYDLSDKLYIGISLPITKDTLGTFQSLVEYDNRPCYLVSGEQIGTGTDGEPLIKDVIIIEEIEYRRKV